MAGGGTGGHLFPAIAVARQFLRENPENRILFCGTGRPMELKIVSQAGFSHRKISAEGFKGVGLKGRILSLLKIFAGIWESLGIIREFSPDVVVGVGGYAAVPMVMAARIRKIPIVLHEQNRVPGIANRYLSFLADRICVSFPGTQEKGFPTALRHSGKICLTGNPVRQEIVDSANTEPEDLNNPFTVLVIGGSQGARSINRAMIEAALWLKPAERYFIIHQTGPLDGESVERAYRDQYLACEVRPFFTDMARCYCRADLLICRAGASTVAEITAAGKAALFIPFPYAADDHQTVNAQSLVEAGAGDMITENKLSGRFLAQKMAYYSSRPEELRRMSRNAKKLGRTDAAKRIVAAVYQVLDSKSGQHS
jgi:UDP-N-acetylglucosamine--N-acetylmuramyl-(pentapeptide) pyrophosphoryl-undecaprenol N-acetylglucosamine transferase